MFIHFFILIATFLSILTGCSSHSALIADNLKGPAIKVQQNKLAQTQSSACEKIKPLQVLPKDYRQAAYAAGILPDDFLSLQKTADFKDVTISIRDVNQSCAPYLEAGYPSKGHEVLSKTFTAESLPPEYQYLAGTVSTLEEKPKPGDKVTDPLSKRYFTKDGKILTCDYDLMDIANPDGERIKGESDEDMKLRQSLNENLPWRGQPAHPVKRIMHGAQAEYLNYLRAVIEQNSSEEPIIGLLKPEAPLTVFTYKGEIYRLPKLEEVLNFYRCHQIALPPEWNLQY